MRMVKTPQVGTVSVEEEPGFWQPCTWLISSFHEKELGNEAELQAFFFVVVVLQFVYPAHFFIS